MTSKPVRFLLSVLLLLPHNVTVNVCDKSSQNCSEAIEIIRLQIIWVIHSPKCSMHTHACIHIYTRTNIRTCGRMDAETRVHTHACVYMKKCNFTILWTTIAGIWMYYQKSPQEMQAFIPIAKRQYKFAWLFWWKTRNLQFSPQILWQDWFFHWEHNSQTQKLGQKRANFPIIFKLTSWK